MAKCDIGKTIIDELKLCYMAEPAFLEELSLMKIGDEREFGEFTFRRQTKKHYKYGYDIYYANKIISTFNFGRYGSLPQYADNVIYRIENEVLYNKELLDISLKLPEILDLVFCHITSIDLARDCKFNVVSRIRKMAKDEDIKVIVNGKVIDKKKDVICGKFIFTLNFSKLHDPSISIKQAKAKRDKTQGMTLCGYNKNKEIEMSSHKNYIKDFYAHPKRLYRLEVHQNNKDIKKYCEDNGIVQDISLIYNQEFLDGMYIAHLSSLLRFTRARTKIDWDEILH